ncbi:peptidoglycan DD-metalloendopeptidase family protein [Ectothiorhodospiraceae bacterium WFHF3C12]|nr:peptidoglycan DD-metalloendopeptidase family protein [Ectothiorhodospiraceae bacterium WFHF3C12]
MRAAAATILFLVSLSLTGCAEFPQKAGGSAPPGGYYTVSRGDTLYSIAWRHNLDYRAVARWNDIGAPYTIYPGDRLRLSPPPRPAGGRSTARTEPDPEPPRQQDPASVTPRAERNVPDSALSWQWPTAGPIRRAFSNGQSGKRGIELGGDAGQAIHAAAGGRVVYSGNGLRGYGNLVIIKHNTRFLTAYGYNRRLLVKEGEEVQPGQRIALMGMGPDNAPALHFELRRDGKPVDPGRVLPAR